MNINIPVLGVQATAHIGSLLTITTVSSTRIALDGAAASAALGELTPAIAITLSSSATAAKVAYSSPVISLRSVGGNGNLPVAVYRTGMALTEILVEAIAAVANDVDVTLRYSDTEGQSWNFGVHRSIGVPGAYLTSPLWRRLGMSRRGRVFELSWSCPRATALAGASVQFAEAST